MSGLAISFLMPNGYLNMLDKQQKRVCTPVGPALAASFEIIFEL